MTKTQAKTKIKNHLKNREHEPVTVTPALVKYWWRIFNCALFDNKLNPPNSILCRNFKDGYYGWCIGDPSKGDIVDIGIKSNMPSRKLMLTTIAHEMIHQWQIANGINNAHNMQFYGWRFKLMKLGLPLRTWIDNGEKD